MLSLNAADYTVIVLIFFVILLIYKIYMHFHYYNESPAQRMTRLAFDKIHGEAYDDVAKDVIKYGSAIKTPRAIDHYRIGTVQLVNANNPAEAHDHYNRALNQIIDGFVDTRDALFIINRINDFNHYFVDYPEIEDLPLQHAIGAYFQQQTTQLNTVRQRPASDDAEFTQKTLLSRQEWHSDSQNVHDSALDVLLTEQFNRVVEENRSINNGDLHDYNEAVNWLKVRHADKLEKINMVLNVINRNDLIHVVPNVREKDVLTMVWRRTYDRRNADNADVMREAIADAILDCVEGETVVCMSGRTKKIWQAMACVDFDENMGVLKSKQALRNEIYQKCARIVDDFVGQNGNASEALKSAYINDENTEQVSELKETIKRQIDLVVDDYKDLLPKAQLDLIILECKTVI
jgi:hypothetical protein